MNYPTMEEVEQADQIQLGRWDRFLPSPGANHVKKGLAVFDAVAPKELAILQRIIERFNELGGITAEISKAIGHEEPGA